MITLGSATKVHLLAGVTDMRRGFEGLFALARALLEADPLSGHVFVREEQLRLARLEKYGPLVGYEVRGSKKESLFRPTKPGCRFCSKRARDATTPHGSGNTPDPEDWFTSTTKTAAAGRAPATS